MQSLENIKKRIKSVKATSKITGAMKLIATAKIRKEIKDFNKISNYCHDFYQIINPLISSLDIPEVDLENEKTLHILITSSLGLCGAFNINVIKFLIKDLKNNDRIIVVGKKGLSYLKSQNLQKNILHNIEVSDKKLNYLELLPLSEMIMQSFKSKEFTSVKLVYTKFINSMNFNPIKIQILPFDKQLFNSDSDKKLLTSFASLNTKGQEIEYDSSKKQIFETILPTFITTIIFAAIIESRVCESASRRNAMETATNNAHNLIENLFLQFNRIRQEKITQEINEIVAGVSNE